MGLCQHCWVWGQWGSKRANKQLTCSQALWNAGYEEGLAPGACNGHRMVASVIGKRVQEHGSSVLGGQDTPLPPSPMGDSEHPLLCLDKEVILQLVSQASSFWCIPALRSQPNLLTWCIGHPAGLGPHLAALGRPLSCNIKFSPQKPFPEISLSSAFLFFPKQSRHTFHFLHQKGKRQ